MIKIKDLKEGEVYVCKLTGRNVLINTNKVEDMQFKDPNTGAVVTKQIRTCHGVWENPVTGYVDTMYPYDNQLTEIVHISSTTPFMG